MDAKLDSIINYLNEVIRLKGKYPDATSFIKLSELYQDLLLEDDVVLAIKKDDLGIRMRVFEEKNNAGVIETDIVPIEYHSTYAYGVAMAIKNYMSVKEDFFKEFLNGYEKIIIDDTVQDKSSSLIIRNYTTNVSVDGYSMQEFIDAILDKYGVNRETSSELIGRISKTSQYIPDSAESIYCKLNYIDILTDGSIPFETLANYYVTNGKYADLKFLLENRGNTRAINHQIACNESFKFLNDALNYIPQVLSQNIDILKPAIDDVVLTIRKAANYGDAISSISCDKESTVKLVEAMLIELDPSGSFSNKFDEMLKNGRLLSYERVSEDEDDYVAYRKNENGRLEKVNDIQNLPFSQYVNMTSTNTLSDVVDLVDGFIRSYMITRQTDLIEDYKYISEMIPAYYEYRACSWLIENGFDLKEVSRIFNTRKADCLGTSKIDSTPIIVGLIDKKDKCGELSRDNILTERDVQARLSFRKSRGLAAISPEVVRDGYAANCAEMLMASRGHLNAELIGYSLGYQLGKSSDLGEMDERMTWVINNCSNTNYDATDLVGVLRNGVPYTTEDNYVTSSGAEIDEMFTEGNRFEFITATDLENSSKPTIK